MKDLRIFLMVLAALTPLAGWSATDAPATPAPAAFVVPPDVKLSRPARDVVKMTSSGVQEDVIKAYIDSSPAPFSLSADNIIHMQGVGVSSGVTSAMLNHDKKLTDQMGLNPPQAPPMQSGAAPYPYPDQVAQPQPANPVSTYTIPQDPSAYYSELAPYGNWNYVPDYGWCWMPGFGLGYAYYPWGILSGGRWWNRPGRGWAWFPGAGYRGGAGYYGGRGYGYYGRGSFSAGFAASRAVGGFRGGNTVSVHAIGGGSHFASGHSFVGGHSFGGGHR